MLLGSSTSSFWSRNKNELNTGAYISVALLASSGHYAPQASKVGFALLGRTVFKTSRPPLHYIGQRAEGAPHRGRFINERCVAVVHTLEGVQTWAEGSSALGRILVPPFTSVQTRTSLEEADFATTANTKAIVGQRLGLTLNGNLEAFCRAGMYSRVFILPGELPVESSGKFWESFLESFLKSF